MLLKYYLMRGKAQASRKLQLKAICRNKQQSWWWTVMVTAELNRRQLESSSILVVNTWVGPSISLSNLPPISALRKGYEGVEIWNRKDLSRNEEYFIKKKRNLNFKVLKNYYKKYYFRGHWELSPRAEAPRQKKMQTTGALLISPALLRSCTRDLIRPVSASFLSRPEIPSEQVKENGPSWEVPQTGFHWVSWIAFRPKREGSHRIYGVWIVLSTPRWTWWVSLTHRSSLVLSGRGPEE